MCKSLETLKANLEKGSRRLSKVTVKNIINAKCFDKIELAYSYDGYEIHKGTIIENPVEWFNTEYSYLDCRIYKIEENKVYISLRYTQNLRYELVIDLKKNYSKETVQEYEILLAEQKRLQEEKERAEKEALENERNKRENLYNTNVTVSEIKNPIITNVEDKEIFVIALEPALNKNDWKVDNDEEIEKKSYSVKYKVTDIVELTEAEYNYFTFNMLSDYDFLSDKGGSCVDDETGINLYNYAVAITCKGKETIIVDPQGYSYARYVSKLAEDIDGNLEKELSTELVINNDLYITTNSSIENTSLYVTNKGNLWSYLENKILNDERLIYNKYIAVVAVTGLTLKEMIRSGEMVTLPIEKINYSLETFTDGILKFETGIAVDLFAKKSILDDVKFAKRLKNELIRATENTTPEPPKPAKKEIKEEPTKNTNINNNVIDLAITRVQKTELQATTKDDWKQDQASKKQLYALYRATGIITTNLIISKGKASELINKSLKGINIKAEVETLTNKTKAI